MSKDLMLSDASACPHPYQASLQPVIPLIPLIPVIPAIPVILSMLPINPIFPIIPTYTVTPWSAASYLILLCTCIRQDQIQHMKLHHCSYIQYKVTLSKLQDILTEAVMSISYISVKKIIFSGSKSFIWLGIGSVVWCVKQQLNVAWLAWDF